MLDNRLQSLAAQLTKMTPQQRQQFAALHKDDPILLGMAKFVSDQQQALRTAVQGAQAGAQLQQPPVVDQTIAQMAPPPAPAGARGLGALPAAAQASIPEGGVAGYAEGGKVGYAGGGDVDYRSYARRRAQELGVDPDLADSIFNIESGYDPEAVSPTGPVGIGQLTRATGAAYGAAGDARRDPKQNIDASLAFMRDLTKKYGGDRAKIAVGYNQGEPFLDAHLKATGGKLVPEQLGRKEPQSYLQKLGNLIPMGSAYAGQPPKQLPPDDLPPPATQGSLSPQGIELMQRNYVPRRRLQDQSAFGMGLGIMPAPVNANASVAEQSQPTGMQLENVAVQQMAQRAGLEAALPPRKAATFERAQAPASLGTGQRPEPISTKAPAAAATLPALTESAESETRGTHVTRDTPEAPAIIAAAQKAAPEMKDKGLSGEDWLTLGLNLMASKNPRFLGALGEAGLGTLKAKQDRTKQESENTLRSAQARYQESAADFNDYLKGPSAAMKVVADRMQAWERTNATMAMIDPAAHEAARRAEERRVTNEVFRSMGLPMPQSASGIKVLGRVG